MSRLAKVTKSLSGARVQAGQSDSVLPECLNTICYCLPLSVLYKRKVLHLTHANMLSSHFEVKSPLVSS